jgi:hypothetical protein
MTHAWMLRFLRNIGGVSESNFNAREIGFFIYSGRPLRGVFSKPLGFVSMKENVGMLCARSRSDIPFVSQDFPAGQKRLKSVNFVTLTCVGDHGDSTQEIWTLGKYG